MKIKTRISPLVSKVCTASLALLGFSCSEHEDMYGTPVGSFEVKDTVTDETGEPVREAIIRVAEPGIASGLYSLSSSLTNIEGRYVVGGSCFPNNSLKVVCIPFSNAYMPDSITVPVNYHYDKDHKGGPWYNGHTDLEVNFKLRANPDK